MSFLGADGLYTNELRIPIAAPAHMQALLEFYTFEADSIWCVATV